MSLFDLNSDEKSIVSYQAKNNKIAAVYFLLRQAHLVLTFIISILLVCYYLSSLLPSYYTDYALSHTAGSILALTIIVLLLLVLASAHFWKAFKRYQCILTNQRLLLHNTYNIALPAINNMALAANPLQKWLKLASVEIHINAKDPSLRHLTLSGLTRQQCQNLIHHFQHIRAEHP